MGDVRLQWTGRRDDVERLALPMQVVETVGASRADRDNLLGQLSSEDDGWRNQLVWGDNRYVLASLAETFAGQVDLVYIDPPFDSRQDYKVRVGIGDQETSASLAKLQSVVEEKAYRDTWGAGVDSYLQMLYDRLILLHGLLSERGSIFLHLAPNVSHLGRVLLDEVFGPENFRAEIIWKRVTAHADTKDFATTHDVILCFARSDAHIWHPVFADYDPAYVAAKYSHVDEEGRRYQLGDLSSPNPRPNLTYAWKGHDPPAYGWRYSKARMAELDALGRIWYPGDTSRRPRLKRYLDDMPGQPVGDLWDDISPVNSQAQERIGYDTQKPEALLERVIESSSDPDSLVLDCFAGSGTTAAVAERFGRRWIACDIGRFAVHTTRKRLLDISGCRPFEVANLGRYERQAWQQARTGDELQAYLSFILALYGAVDTTGSRHVHGTMGRRAVHVGPVSSPVTLEEIRAALEDAAAGGHAGLDVLGWEWEMGLHELVQDEARDRGVDLRLRRIPREVMDERAVVAGDIVFHELAYLKTSTANPQKRQVTVTLEDFVLSNPDLVPDAVRDKVASWSDYIDYWAVDFTYAGDTFHNQWQSFRTRVDRKLQLTAEHAYDDAGTYTILVKVIDVFGNDTTTAIDVTVS